MHVQKMYKIVYTNDHNIDIFSILTVKPVERLPRSCKFEISSH